MLAGILITPGWISYTHQTLIFFPLPPTRENLVVEGNWYSATEVEAFSLAKPQVICADKI